MPVTEAALNDESDGGTRTLSMSGRLTLAHINDLARQAREIVPDGKPLVIDLEKVERMDTTGAWLVYRLTRDWKKAGLDADIRGGGEDACRLIERIG